MLARTKSSALHSEKSHDISVRVVAPACSGCFPEPCSVEEPSAILKWSTTKTTTNQPNQPTNDDDDDNDKQQRLRARERARVRARGPASRSTQCCLLTITLPDRSAMDFHSVPAQPSCSAQSHPAPKPSLPQSAGVPGSSAFLYIPHRSTRSSKLTPPPAPKLSYSQDASLSSKSSSISERPVTPSSPAHSTNKNMVSSNNSVQTPHQSPIQNKSRPISTSSRFSRQNAREADVLGKILGWRHSKTLRTSTSFKSSPPSLNQLSNRSYPEIFRPSSSRISSSVPRPSQDGAFPNPSLVQQEAQEDTQTSTKKHSTSSRPYLTQQSSSDLTSSTHASSNPSSSVTHAGSSQTSFHLLPPSSPVAAHLLPSSNESSQHQPPNGPIKPFALRRPVLKKSFSSGQLHQHFNLTQDPSKPHSQSSAPSHTPQSTQPSSLASSLHIPERFNHQPTTPDRPNSLVVPDETNRIVPASRSQLINAPYASQPHHSHYSAQLASPLPKHPSMHGVASNESIRTAKPNTEFKSLNALSALPSLADDDSPSPQDAHRNNVSPSDHDASTPTVRRPRRFQNPRIFDIFTPVHRREPVDPMPFNKDPRFVIWAENPASSLRQKPAASIYPASLKRSSATIETRHYPNIPPLLVPPISELIIRRVV
ncbi:hypothetical protein PCASD_20406 [Puccinia coronata f. sp. avenae]|uniref:Uncharacterized protein n=1 Tax=Puccinia coronata f. sp. avenae TaxID=200324 RepID=A0A2N5SMU2_9BASI|nr:hypothetical protein PCASD_20406 [Puccinia coronata f. sp. avenae]